MKKSLLIPALHNKQFISVIACTLLSFSSLAQRIAPDTLETSHGNRSLMHFTEPVQILKSEQLNKGVIYSPKQLLSGQFSGLRVMPNNGEPGSSADMVLRLGNSLLQSNDLLIVLDGVPLPGITASAFSDLLNFINPNDIASVALVKDAAAMAVYGGRAINGVLYLTTKRGSKDSGIKIDLTSKAGISVLGKKADVLSADAFREVIQNKLPNRTHLLGNTATDWQDVIYRRAFSHEQHIGLSGAILKRVPYRISYGHLRQQGIVKTSGAKRNALAFSLRPSFLQDHLNLNLHLQKADENIHIADRNAIPSALAFDPTQPVYEANNYGGYRTYLLPDGTVNLYASRNPLSLLEQQQNTDHTNTLLGHAHLQYKLNFLPKLSLNVRYARMDQKNNFTRGMNADFATVLYPGGRLDRNENSINWERKEAFIAFDQAIKPIDGNLRVVGGLTNRQQYIKHKKHPMTDRNGRVVNESYSYSEYQQATETIYGNLHLLAKNRYLFEITLAQDKSSSWSSGESSMSGSAGVSWNLAKESFLVNNATISDLRLFSNYSQLTNPENNAITRLYSPKFEREHALKWNTGIAIGLFDDKLEAGLNYSRTNVNNLGLGLDIPFGSNGGGYDLLWIHQSGFKASSFEADVRYNLKANSDFSWSIGANMALLQSHTSEFGNGLQQYYYDNAFILTPGRPINSFNLYEQLYDKAGKPVEGSFKTNSKGEVKKEIMSSKDPNFIFGIHSGVSYKKLSADFLLRGSAGNHVYNQIYGDRGALSSANYNNYLENISGSYSETGFNRSSNFSSHYLELASFMRLEYCQLAYDFGSVMQEKVRLRINATAQNAFVLTKYKGQDPEVANGIDTGRYPQPRTFSLGLNLSI